ncbi:MAG: O-antigen ligase family protein [Burkholderiales bacterium]|nr:O-antigen ligase family protein [Burkholderiales bacterium]
MNLPTEKEAVKGSVLAPVNRGADRIARCAAIGLGFSIPLSVALDNVLLVLVLAGWLAGGMYREQLAVFVRNPVALSAAILFALFALGLFYGDRNPGDGMLYLRKYLDLLFIPVLVFLFRDATTRRQALHALAVSFALVLALSSLIKVGVIPPNPFLLGDPDNPVVLKQYLTHGILMAFGAFLFAQLAHDAASSRMRWCWGALAALATINVTAMMAGRTGYLVLALLALYWGYLHLRWKGLAAVALAAATFAVLLATIPGPFQQRLALTAKEVAEWQPGEATQTSIGLRLEFYRNSLAIIADHPLLGAGTGSFPKVYEERVRGTSSSPSRNPHNEFLHVAVQIGLAGLLLMFNLFLRQWRVSNRLASPTECRLARAMLMMMIAGCLFNSMLTDHTEGLLFAWLTGVLYGGIQFTGHGESKREAKS